jgi:serine/threonine protein kinase/CHASE2 domain-containing sensor protein
MAISSSRNNAFWRSDTFIGVMVVLAVLMLHQATDLIGTLERRFYDFGLTSSARVPSDRIAIIAIDDASIAALGRWPWPRDVHAALIDKLHQAHAKTIGHTAFFFEPQTDRGLDYIRKLREVVQQDNPAEPTANDPRPKLLKLMAEAEVALDTDAKLASSLDRAGNVVLPSVFRLETPLGRAEQALPPFALKNTVVNVPDFSLDASSGQYPLTMLGSLAASTGHLNLYPDADGAVRHEPLLVNYYGQAMPSMALQLAAHSLNLGMGDIRLDPLQNLVQLGNLRISVDTRAMMLPQFYPQREGRSAFQIDSFVDVLNNKVPLNRYADKIVLIGGTAAGLGTSFHSPVHELTPVEYLAHTLSSLLREHFIVQPAWGGAATAGALLLVALYLIVLLPRLSAGVGALTTTALLVALLGLEFGLLSRAYLWLQLVLPAFVLLSGHLALTTKRFKITEAGKHRSDEESAETNRMMGLALQGQGQLDMAFDRYRRVPASDALLDNLSNLALDFERKRQFNKAQAVYEHMGRMDKNYRDLGAKLNKVRNLAETVILGGSAHPGGTMLLADGAIEKPMLGRYQVEKELGKGAMGVVYQGRDPKIGRVVAIKTLALSQEFEGAELTDARDRFFQEAKTAGRLQHQHIVTIFDAGEEHDLAYIAMEFLQGRDLSEFCHDGQLLPMRQVVSIVARVAEALSYAHRQHVVHRDIKPANIMYEPGSDSVKVTDFGIARITDSSKTKTGLVLGTPSFMSPEQISGRKVDGRSDLYSLGVMLFQLLTGVLPFRGESMAELMYKIANEDAPDIRRVRSDIPEQLAYIVAFSLQKHPEDRYQDGSRMAADLDNLLKGMDNSAKIATARADASSAEQSGYQSTLHQDEPGYESTINEEEPGYESTMRLHPDSFQYSHAMGLDEHSKPGSPDAPPADHGGGSS